MTSTRIDPDSRMATRRGRRLSGRKRALLFALVGLAAVAAAACAGSASGPTAGDSSANGAGAPAASVAGIIDSLPGDFTINVYQGADALGGKSVRLSDVVARGKPVVLNFWAGLCPPCRAEMPDLEAVHTKFGDRVLLLGLDVGKFVNLGTRSDALRLIDEIGITYPAGGTDDSSVVIDYELLGMPSTYFITPEGKVTRKWTGALNEAKLSELVQDLIAASNA